MPENPDDEDSGFKEAHNKLFDYLNTFDPEERLEKIKDLIHSLKFEVRLWKLTDEEREHMYFEDLTTEQRVELKAMNEVQRDQRISEIARARYFRRCAWSNYLNGHTNEKPFSSKKAE
jgi:predicted RNA binding protein with dsRBD fold (UPF0201 family)